MVFEWFTKPLAVLLSLGLDLSDLVRISIKTGHMSFHLHTAIFATEVLLLLVLICGTFYHCSYDRTLATNGLSGYRKQFYLGVS